MKNFDLWKMCCFVQQQEFKSFYDLRECLKEYGTDRFWLPKLTNNLINRLSLLYDLNKNKVNYRDVFENEKYL